MGYPTIKLTSFDGTGRSTAIRLALHVAGIPFEDERLAPAEWETFRSRAPFAQSPIMTVNGTVFAQASALMRYVGVIAGTLPANPILGLAVDEIVAAVDAFFNAYELVTNADLDDTTRRHVLQAAYNDTFLKSFETLNQLAGQQAKGFAVGDQLTIADLALFGLMDAVKRGLVYPFGVEVVARCGNLADLYSNVSKQAKVAEWMATSK